jgi:hypothetical protein
VTRATVYSIDTSSILEARNRMYPPDVFPGLWQRIEALIAASRLCATEEVKREIDRIDDETKRWSRAQTGFYVPVDREQTDEVTRLLSMFGNLVDAVTGSSGGDPFVIALARLRGHVLVTQEKKTTSPKRTKIPNVCEYYGIPYITVLELIRREGWTF